MRDIIIIGAGGFGREASLLVEEINNLRGNTYKLLGFIDEDKGKWNNVLRGYRVLGGWDVITTLSSDTGYIVVVGNPAEKKSLVEKADNEGCKFINLIHPEVAITSDVIIGSGVLISKGNIITTNITIGNYVSINPGCGIGHDAVIEDYSTLMWQVSISGFAKVGKGSMIGTKAVVLQNKVIGQWSVVGAGAVVTKNIPKNSTAIGVPARVV